MRVVLADDHGLFRAGIRSLLQDLPEVRVVGETGDGQEAIELIEKHRPDIVLLDIKMPGLNGLEVAARVASISPKTRILIVSMHAAEMYVAQAMRAGVAGYLLKDAADEELALALSAVARGEIYLSPQISRHVVDGYLRAAGPENDPLAGLTARQREILQLIAEGRSRGEIASRLGVSVKTVDAHRAQIMERLGVRDVAGLIRVAIRTGLVAGES